jgi:hypothetical protein
MGVLMEIAGLIPQLLRERKMLFGNARSSPEKQLGVLLQLKEDARLQADGCEGGRR